jgi:hypothetical protein
MAQGWRPRERYGEGFWRAHHETWRQSDLNQREYCEAHGLSLKAFGNWRAKFKAEPQPPLRKLLYRRGGLSHRLSHTLSHSLSHMTNGSPEPALIVPPARDGHRRAFSEADKRRIVEEAGQPGASLSEVVRRCGRMQGEVEIIYQILGSDRQRMVSGSTTCSDFLRRNRHSDMPAE